MDLYTYQSFDEPRTASRHTAPIKSTQSWKTPKSISQSEINHTLNQAAKGEGEFQKTLDSAMTYAPTDKQPTPNKGFQFSDIIDIINPLHHLPIVGTAYRGLTGDELHPLSGIIGGAAYGGPIGAITGTINAVSKIQTGKDMGEQALSLFNSDAPNPVSKNKDKTLIMQKENLNVPLIDDITTIKLAAMPPRRS